VTHLTDTLLELERRLWLEGVETYRELLDGDCLTIFPDPVGAMARAAVIEAVATGSRWTSVQFVEPRLVMLTGEAALVTYKADARCETDNSAYAARIHSAWVRRGEGWRMAYHHQTPIR
jgi:ketosteroid isomerase-like protein